jgi:hypothetical protein
MSLPTCPACDGATEFLGNESSTGKSWFRCIISQRVFSLRLPELPRFDFADMIKRTSKDDSDNEGALVERA